MFSPNFIFLGGGVHKSEPKCHLDMKTKFFISEWGVPCLPTEVDCTKHECYIKKYIVFMFKKKSIGQGVIPCLPI